jgi:hypothetical protein
LHMARIGLVSFLELFLGPRLLLTAIQLFYKQELT